MKFLLLSSIILINTACSLNKKAEHKTVVLADKTVINLDKELGDQINHEVDFPENVEVEEAIITALENDDVFKVRARKFASVYKEKKLKIRRYVVQEDDTLMLISYKIYGTYMKWRELQDLNKIETTKLEKGMLVRYIVPKTKFEYKENGLPYVIQRNDTLLKISDNVYSTENRWKEIYDNNRHLIQNPNIIYAGFTIFYVPDESRDLASKKMNNL